MKAERTCTVFGLRHLGYALHHRAVRVVLISVVSV